MIDLTQHLEDTCARMFEDWDKAPANVKAYHRSTVLDVLNAAGWTTTLDAAIRKDERKTLVPQVEKLRDEGYTWSAIRHRLGVPTN